jgi:acyl carrier protein
MANGFVDFFAQQRRGGKYRHRAIIWSDWNDTGAITRVSETKAASIARTFERLGLRTFTGREGRALFDRALACAAGGTVILGPMNRERFVAMATELLHARPGQRETVTPVPAELSAPSPHSVLTHLERWEAERRAGAVVLPQAVTAVIGLDEIKALEPALIHRIHAVLFGVAPVKSEVAAKGIDYAPVIAAAVKDVLKLKGLDSARAFQDYGLDSISAMVLATRLERELRREVPPQWLIEFPTVDGLARHLTAHDESHHMTA